VPLPRPDLIVTDCQGVPAAQEAWGESPAPVVMVTPRPEAAAPWVSSDCVFGCLVKPIDEAELAAAVALAARLFARLKALCEEADGLRRALEERKLVERAKGSVMRRLVVARTRPTAG
jgi:response regulator NasT